MRGVRRVKGAIYHSEKYYRIRLYQRRSSLSKRLRTGTLIKYRRTPHNSTRGAKQKNCTLLTVDVIFMLLTYTIRMTTNTDLQNMSVIVQGAYAGKGGGGELEVSHCSSWHLMSCWICNQHRYMIPKRDALSSICRSLLTNRSRCIYTGIYL